MEEIKQQKIEELKEAGFTERQAEVLVEIMHQTAIVGGMF